MHHGYYTRPSLRNDNDRETALKHVRDLLEVVKSNQLTETDLLTKLQGETLLAHLSSTPTEGSQLARAIALPSAQDCRSRFTRRLWYSLTGDYDLAAQELKGIRERGVTYPAMDFYEQLISQSENPQKASGTFD